MHLQPRHLYSVMVASVLSLVPELALSHSLGSSSGPTPPLRAYFEEAMTLGKEVPNGLGVRGVLDQFKLWPTDSPLIFCFNNGKQSLRRVFVETSQRWLDGTSLKFDFGGEASYRTCTAGTKAAIRVTFNPALGHWSYVGTDSLKHKNTTLSIGFAEVPAAPVHRNELEKIILHEIGHAIGFQHEHQSPDSKCEDEFDWPKVYSFAKTHWGWVKKDGSVDKQLVDFNLRMLVSIERLRTTDYDRTSVMHYHFEPVLFKRGKGSPCFVGHNQQLSQTDKGLAREAYPIETALQDEHLQKRADVASAALAPMKMSAQQLSRVGRALGQVLSAAERRIILDFDLARATGSPRARGPGDVTACDPQTDQAADVKTIIACEVASDGSALVIGVEPR